MPESKIKLLERALERQKQARKQAEKILESKSRELYNLTRQLKEANERLEEHLTEKTSELQGVFANIVDPYVVMDLEGNVIRMNAAAKTFLGFDYEKNGLNLGKLVHPDYADYTRQALGQLYKVGSLKNYKAKIFIADGSTRFVQVNSSMIYDRENRPIAAQGIVRDITRETEVSKLLAEQKKQLDIIVENSPLGIMLSSSDHIIRSNPAFENMLGYSKADLKDQDITEISMPEDPEEHKAFEKKLRSGALDSFTLRRRYAKKDGTQFFAKTTVSAVRDAEDQIAYRVTILEDITKEYEAEQKIRASENRLSSLIQNMNTAVLLEDPNRRIALTNTQFCELFGIPAKPEDLIGSDCSNAAEESKALFKDEDAFVQRIQEILGEGKLVQNDVIEMKDGRILERDYIPIYDQDTYQGHLWTYTDITIRRRYKHSLEQQKKKYSSIIANMNLGLMEVDLKDRIQLVNQSFLHMTGYEESDLIGSKASDVLRVGQPDRILEMTELRKTGVSCSYEVEILTKQNEKKYWLISGAPNYDDSGTLVGTIGIHLDITDQKELEFQKQQLLEELQIRNQELEEYAHVVSHDLKSPLRSINALTTWLREDQKDRLDHEGLTQIEMIQEKVESMDGLINGILEYSSIRTDLAQRTDVDLNQLICQIREMIYVPEHIKIVILNPLPFIRAVPAQMHQLFQNLLSNAVAHIDKDEGLVEVDFEKNEGFWKFSVRDNGIGISPEYHDKIFEIFESFGAGENASGTGIGLSIVNKIVGLYEGKVWIESEVNQGTTFHFTLKM